MIYRRGSDILIQPEAEAGIKEFSEYWNRLVENQALKNELSLPREELMKALLNPGYFFYGTSDDILDANSKFGLSLEELQFHSVTQSSFQSNVQALSKNSPWLIIIDDGIQKLRQNGQSLKLF